MTRLYTFSYYWMPVVIYCVLIFILSSHPMPETIPSWPLKDKLLHFAVYSVLGALSLRGFRHLLWRHHGTLVMAASILFTGLYGVSDEWHQYYVPSRTAELGDLLADFSGGVCGVWFYDWLTGKYPALGRF